MAAFGTGSQLWRVDVVLRRDGATDSDVAAIVESIGSALDGLPTLADEAVLASVEPAFSYDMQPPEGSLGVSCWVRADTVGEAAQIGHDVVLQACRRVKGRTYPLWDLRLLPRTAISPRADLAAAQMHFVARRDDGG